MLYLILNLGYFGRMDPHLRLVIAPLKLGVKNEGLAAQNWKEESVSMCQFTSQVSTARVKACKGCHLHVCVSCTCGGVLHTHWHGLAAVECTDRRLSLGVCGELDKSAA